ncbi:SCP-like extracellular [Altererythrobacter sp. SALINAS58]|uniref:CAP domain-containing protein n=1 Tax=Alteripontixanthobacter muriae TaxID=2705546 RepID=UPI001576EB6E|nr:CAP domain-containing protein [Alteripontixanthobacter muriae]NTZ42121.1 SCP-like extracellular [Alteripontixanthobacter muriae]
MLKRSGGLFLLAASTLLIGAKPYDDFSAVILAEHNAERARLGQLPLQWNDELALGAKDWATYLAQTGRFEHSPEVAGQPRLGENIWGGTPGKFGAKRMVRAWIAEKRHFKHGVFPANSSTSNVQDVSHYTQIIWRETREVGCSTSTGENEQILVCRYNSPGNVVGRRPI